MNVFDRLAVRLFLSYLVVIVAAGAVVFATTRLIAPTFFRTNLSTVSTTTSTVGPGGSSSTVGPGGSSSTSTSRSARSTTTTPAAGDASSRGRSVPIVLAAALAEEPTALPDEDVNNAFLSALDTALLVGLVVGLFVAAILAGIITRRIMRPIDRVRETTRHLAAGRYERRVPIPAERELALLAGDVNALADTLQATEQSRARLISDVSHELRNPLSTIEGYMEGLVDGVIEPTDEVFASVGDEAARLKRIVSDLSLLSRLEEGALPIESTQIDLREVAGSVADRLRPQFLEKDVALKIAPGEPLTINGDHDRIAQVFTNLIGNALGHTPAGGSVSIVGRLDGAHAEVAVIDSGEGIEPADLGRVFDRFFRADPAQGSGTGIGLTIAHRIVRVHDGEITVESEGTGHGATFSVRIPHVEAGPVNLPVGDNG
ncbi:MAG: HAMP domain-containing histidine kinase [Acidimicrobiia bacterium]|nr:HAMP domain-containing histidine kinase [Acidimicrobiia bacterium]